MQKTMNITAAITAMAVVVCLSQVSVAAPFVNPPESNCPQWVTAFPYQRNILVGFDTDPHQWPDHVTSPTPGERKALTPDLVHHEGTDDPVLYPSDWIAGNVDPSTNGYTEWMPIDTETGSNRKGILALHGSAGTTITLVWHIDNWDRPYKEKHFYAEVEFYTTGNDGIDELISSTGQIETLDAHYEVLADGWVRWWSWATLVPNPEWEQMVNTITFQEDGFLLMDYMHIATECVPEPASITLLGLIGLTITRRNTIR